jgi:hypothetical protein
MPAQQGDAAPNHQLATTADIVAAAPRQATSRTNSSSISRHMLHQTPNLTPTRLLILLLPHCLSCYHRVLLVCTIVVLETQAYLLLLLLQLLQCMTLLLLLRCCRHAL